MKLTDLIHPLSEGEFLERYWQKQPVHIQASEASARNDIGWPQLNGLFAIRRHWTANNVKLLMNSQPVERSHYMEDVVLRGGNEPLASARQIQNFLSMGASLVLDAVQDVLPSAALMTHALADRFSAVAGANFYASFKGVQAFASHCDTHEVFAVHCEGRKRWRIYENRADNPPDTLVGD